MPDRKRIIYSYKSIEEWEQNDEQVRSKIQNDTGVEQWIANRAIPPTEYPPPLTSEAIEEIRKLNGVLVRQIDEDS